jgi:hypothetical protein
MTVSDEGAGIADPSVAMIPEPPRVRLMDVRAHRSPSGRYRVDVELETPGPERRRVSAMHEDMPSAFGEVRIAAEAALAALRAALPDAPKFVLAGAKTVRAFDQTVTLVLVGISGGEGPARLLGAACNEENVSRAAVLAVLNATNRVRAPGMPGFTAGAAVAGEARHG